MTAGVPMSPKSRQKKKYYANELVDAVKSLKLTETDEKLVVIHALKSLNLYEDIRGKQEPSNRGRKPIPLQMKKIVWDFWHEHSQEN